MVEKIRNKLIILLTIFVLVIMDFITVGMQIVSYAISNTDVTNVSNVLFAAKLLDDNGNENNFLEKDIINKDMKLRLNIQIIKEGYFNGKVLINDSNFRLKTNITNEYINNINNNCIELNQINPGEEITLDLEIEPIKDEDYKIEYLNKISSIQILGLYVMGKNSTKEVDTTREVQLKLNSQYENEKIENSTQIVTNKIYEIQGVNKRVIQLEITSKLSGSTYPIKSTKIEADVIDGTEEIQISKRGTYATNNNQKEIESNWNKDTNKIEINISNLEENGQVKWNKEGSDKVLITYFLNENSNVINNQINVITNIELYDNTILNNELNNIIEEEVDGAISCELQTQQELFKGNLYYGEETKLQTNTIVDIRIKNIANVITVKQENSKYLNYNGEIIANLKTIGTKINKKDALNLLGNTGSILFKTQEGQELAILNKDNIQTIETENIEIWYEGQTNIIIEITNAENEGKIIFENIEVLQESLFSKQEINKLEQLKISNILESDKNVSLKEMNKTIQLKEPETYAVLTSNVNTLSTLQTNENVQFNIILKTDDIKYNLYKNPIIEIHLPEEVTNISADFNAVFLDELQVKGANIYNGNSGNKIMRIELLGEQIKHSNNISEGIIINVNANIDVQKTTNTKDTNIKMLYTNDNSNGNIYEQNLPIKLKSKDGLLVYNKIENYNQNGSILETEEPEVLTETLNVESNGKEANANTVLVNNYEEEIKNVKIIGNNTDDSTMDLDILKSFEISKDAQIYYSENGENWTQNLDEIQNIQSYIIEINSIPAQESLHLNYSIKLPENLNEQLVGKLQQNVIYTYKEQEFSQNFGVEFKTEDIIKNDSNSLTENYNSEITGNLEVNTTTKLGTKEINEDDIVYEGETLKNIITISNKTGRDLNNINVKVNQQNAVIYDLKPKEVINEAISHDTIIEHSYEELDTGEKIFNKLETIKSGEIIELEYEVVTKIQDNSNEKTFGEIEITADSVEKINKRTIENKIEEAELKLNSKFGLNEEVELFSEFAAKTIVTLENTNNKKLEDINVTIQLSELNIRNTDDVEFYTEDLEDLDKSKIDNVNYNEGTKTITVNIKEIKENEKINIILTTMASKIPLDQNNTTARIFATASTQSNKTYSSNIAKRNITQSEKNITIQQETTVGEDTILKNGDNFNIKIIVNNNTNQEEDIYIEDDIDRGFTINNIKLIKDNESKDIEEDKYEKNILMISEKMPGNSKIELDINITVNTYFIEESGEITNVVQLSYDTFSINSNILKFNVLVEEEKNPDDNNNDGDNNNENGDSNNNSNNEGNSNNKSNNEKFNISGTAWLDKNKDGKLDNNEERLSKIDVKLVNKNTGEFLQNAQTQTNENGEYKIEIEEGQYIVIFLYDTQKYGLTEFKKSGISEEKNSDAISKNIKINNQDTLVGITDTINISGMDINNIDIGLIEKEVFDLKLDKYISKVSVQNAQGTKKYEYDNEKLAKIEIKSKYYKGSTVTIEYKIVITNEGEIEAYANDIIDYLPSELKFSSELNKNWYISNDGNLHNSSLESEKIQAGESKQITLILTKTLNENEGGLISNIAEIYKSSNNLNIEDKDSKAGNKAIDEDDISTADVIISVGTGIVQICLIGLFIILIISGVVIYIVKRKEGEKFDKKWKE